MTSRCQHCGDPCGPQPEIRNRGICETCAAWSNLYFAFAFTPLGLDSQRFESARRYFDERRRVPTDARLGALESMVAKLLSRVSELEVARIGTWSPRPKARPCLTWWNAKMIPIAYLCEPWAPEDSTSSRADRSSARPR